MKDNKGGKVMTILKGVWRPGANQVACFLPFLESFDDDDHHDCNEHHHHDRQKVRKDADDDHERRVKAQRGSSGSRWGLEGRGQSSGLFFPSFKSLDELLPQHILSGKNTTSYSTYFIQEISTVLHLSEMTSFQ